MHLPTVMVFLTTKTELVITELVPLGSDRVYFRLDFSLHRVKHGAHTPSLLGCNPLDLVATSCEDLSTC